MPLYDLILPFKRSISLNAALRAEAYQSRSAYRLFVKGYISALRDLGVVEHSINQVYDGFHNAEDDIFIYDEKTNNS